MFKYALLRLQVKGHITVVNFNNCLLKCLKCINMYAWIFYMTHHHRNGAVWPSSSLNKIFIIVLQKAYLLIAYSLWRTSPVAPFPNMD